MAVYLTISSVLITAITVLFLLGLCAVQLVMVPRYIEIFQDFDMQLPSLTLVLIQTPSSVFLAVYTLGIVALPLKEAVPQLHFGLKLVMNLFVLLLGLVMFFVYAAGLYLPMNTLMDNLMSILT